jgi:AAA+ ATPase superfamily predicted ATPase
MTTQLNPFHFGALALGEAFADREAELAELRRDVLNGQDVVIFAPRRFGKTSLVERARVELVAEDVLVAHVDVMTAPTKEKLAEKLARTIHDDVASVLYRAREAALDVFRGLRVTPKISIDPNTGALGFGFDAGYEPEDVDATLERLLELPGEIGADRKRRVALVLDEFQEVVGIDQNLPRLLRAVFQRQPEVAHVYLGSKRHMLESIFNDENEPFWRSARRMELSVIPPELFAPFIRGRFRASGKDVSPATVDAVLAFTGGHPYATQELCYFLWERTSPGGPGGEEELEAALEGVLNSEHAHFGVIWDGASAGQRLLLAALANEPGRPFSAEYRRRHRLPAATNVQKALRALVRRELVARRQDGAVEISEPFLAEWIRREVGD